MTTMKRKLLLYCLLTLLTTINSISHASTSAKGIAYPGGTIPNDIYNDIKQDVANGKIGSIRFGFLWIHAHTGKIVDSAQNCQSTEVAYPYRGTNQFRCYKKDSREAKIRELARLGAKIRIALWAIPAEFRVDSTLCTPPNDDPFFAVFCGIKPQNIPDFADYAGMLARHYRGVATDFVILNEVNTKNFHNYACTDNGCDWDRNINHYAKVFKAAGDRIRAESGSRNINVLIPLAGRFTPLSGDGIGDDNITGDVVPMNIYLPKIFNIFSSNTASLAKKFWQIAPHGHPSPYASSTFEYGIGEIHSAPNEPGNQVTSMGSMNIFMGFLHKWGLPANVTENVVIDEVGLAANPGNTNADEVNFHTCLGYINVNGTPGIKGTSWWFKGASGDEVSADARLGLIDHNNNRRDIIYNYFRTINSSCGFNHIHAGEQFTKIRRGENSNRYIHTSRVLTDGFHENPEVFYLAKNKPTEPSEMLFECAYLTSPPSAQYRTILSNNPSCQDVNFSLFPMGPVGFIYKNQENDTAPLYHCAASADNILDSQIFTTNTNNCATFIRVNSQAFGGYEKSNTPIIMGYVRKTLDPLAPPPNSNANIIPILQYYLKGRKAL